MGRVAIIIGLIVLAAAFVWMNVAQDHKIVVSEAKIMRSMDGKFMASAKVSNDGRADVLLGVSSRGFDHAHFVGARGDLIVPGGASAILAGDGAHIMMSGGEGIEVGQLVPVELTFKNAGKISARAQVVDGAMDHSGMMAIEVPDVRLSLRFDADPDRNGAIGLVDIEGLSIISHSDGTPHIDGEGHGHVYLNGLKLQRLYDTRFETGALRPGDYVLRVSVNSNDHRPFAREGVPIAVEVEFTVE